MFMVQNQEWFRPSVICLTKCTFFAQAHQVNLCTWICTWICKVFKYYVSEIETLPVPELTLVLMKIDLRQADNSRFLGVNRQN